MYTFGRPRVRSARAARDRPQRRRTEAAARVGARAGRGGPNRLRSPGCNGSNAAVTAGGEAYVWGYAQEGNRGRGGRLRRRARPRAAQADESDGREESRSPFLSGQHTAALCVGGSGGDGTPGARADVRVETLRSRETSLTDVRRRRRLSCNNNVTFRRRRGGRFRPSISTLSCSPLARRPSSLYLPTSPLSRHVGSSSRRRRGRSR